MAGVNWLANVLRRPQNRGPVTNVLAAQATRDNAPIGAVGAPGGLLRTPMNVGPAGTGKDPSTSLMRLGSLMPGLGGDVLGPLADLRMMRQNPDTRTVGNAIMFGAGLLPIIPSVASMKSAKAKTAYRVVDVFGDGGRIDHYDDAKGLMYSAQKMPSGYKWTVFEPRPKSEGGDQVLGEMFKFNSIDEAASSVRGLRISDALRAKNKTKYGDIPNTWDGEAKKIAKKLADSGVSVSRYSSSTQSKSRYIYLNSGAKIRIADHALPGDYESPDLDFRYGGDIDELIARAKKLADE